MRTLETLGVSFSTGNHWGVLEGNKLPDITSAGQPPLNELWDCWRAEITSLKHLLKRLKLNIIYRTREPQFLGF